MLIETKCYLCVLGLDSLSAFLQLNKLVPQKRKAENQRENSALPRFPQHFSRVLLRHSVLYYCLETFYSLSVTG